MESSNEEGSYYDDSASERDEMELKVTESREQEPAPSTSRPRKDSVNSDDLDEKPEEKRFKRGVVYISFIPHGMTPRKLRVLLSEYAPVGRMYMQKVIEKGEKKRKRKNNWQVPDNYSEGWVEFLKKRHAKQVAALLNNQPIGGKKKDKFHDVLWNLKYLSRFKWIHLVERLSYEKAIMRQKMQNEISQAKRVANFFKETVEREEIHRKRQKNKSGADSVQLASPSPYVFAQRDTAEEKKNKKPQVDGDREKFLKSLFA